MKYLVHEIPSKVAYIIPIGDLHVGDKSFNKEGKAKLFGYLKWVKEHEENARIFLGGDLFNAASRESATSPFESDDGENEFNTLVKIFEPYRHLIIGAIEGNHEERILNDYGFSQTAALCHVLKIPYCKYSAVLRLKVGKRKGSNRFYQNYFIYFHHTTGGGATLGSKINRVEKLRNIIEGADVYVGFHNHQLAAAPLDVYYPSMQKRDVLKRRIWFVDAGHYLNYQDSYAEKKMLAPAKIGSPRIRFSGKKNSHDVHISL
jgi:hypothetical protein